MKQMKKTNWRWKLSSMLSLAGLLAVGLGFAAPAIAGPDLQVRAWVSDVHQNANRTYNFTIRGQLKNVGNADYVSRRNQQVLFLHEVGKARHITDWRFSRLNRGQVMNVHVPVRNHPGGEFVPAYELALSFDPDIYIDSNPANDDRNRRNNQATVSSRTLSGAFARASGAAGGIHVRPFGVRPGVIKPRRPRVGGPVLRGKKPDLIPLLRGSNPFAGTFKVKNRGGATAGASKLVVSCKKVGHRGPGGGCADSDNPAVNRLYNASLGGLVASVPALRAGQVYTVHLPFKGLKWLRGKYKFTLNADATHAVAESNERNNLKRIIRRR